MKQYPNFYRYFLYRVLKTPDKIYLCDDKESLSYYRCFRLILSYIHQMKNYGLDEDSAVAFRITRTVDSLLLLYALLAIGCKIYLCDPHQGVNEFISENSLADANFSLTDEKAGNSCFELIFQGKESVSLFRKEEDYAYLDDHDGKKGNLVIFTSGSSSKSKAVMQSQDAFICNALASEKHGGYTYDDINMLFLPLSHVFGLALSFIALVLDHAVYIPEKTDISSLADCINRKKVTRMNGVPTIYLSLVRECEEKHKKITTLRNGFIGGGPYTKEQFELIESKLNMHLISVYGMSEIVGITVGDASASQDQRPLGVGKVYDGIEVKIENGEVLAKGNSLMKGYAFSKTSFLDREGYFHTGDLGHFDENGILYLDGRASKVIIRKGVNISSRKIEDAINQLPYVFCSVVLPKKDEFCGEVPYAFVELKDKADEETIKKDISSRLHPNEMPVRIEILEHMPLLPNGKIDQKELKARL